MSAVSDLPGCVFPLRTEAAQGEYDLLGRALLHAGRLTLDLHRVLSSYALQVDTITTALHAGKPVRGSWLTQLDRTRAKLRLAELESASVPTLAPRPNKFADAGFSCRRMAAAS